MEFTSDVSGSITALRFYKGAGNTGTHVGHIWSSSGTLLGTATLTNETATGWQQVNFNAPIPVTANAVYVASSFAPTGHYADTPSQFANALDNSPLHAVSNATVI